MSSTQMTSDETARIASPEMIDMKLEVVVIPVSDIDRAKGFYQRLGWRLDADLISGDGSRVVQLTPPGSACSVKSDVALRRHFCGYFLMPVRK